MRHSSLSRRVSGPTGDRRGSSTTALGAPRRVPALRVSEAGAGRKGMVSGGAVHPYNGLGERPTVRVPRRSGEYGQYASGERTPGGGARTPGSGKAIVVAPADGLDSRQRARKRFRKVRTMVVASQAFSDAGRQRRERREGSRDITAPPVVDDDLELRVVEAARRKAHATRGPRVANGGFVTSGLGAPRMFAAPDDIRKRTIVSQHIVLGCREDAMDLKGLQELGVTHVLNACSQLPNYHPDHFVYHKIAILDAPKAPIVTCAEVAAQFLQRVERVGGRCLVHCIAGSSRSVTLTLMHLMISHRVPLHVGFHHVNRMRPQANPNEGFKLQLALLEVKVLGGSSVAAKDAGAQWAFYEWNVRKATVPQIKDRYGKGQHARGGNAESSSCVLS